MKLLLTFVAIMFSTLSFAQTIAQPTILEIVEDDRIATIYWNSKTTGYQYPWDSFKNQGSMSYKIEWGEVGNGFTNQLFTPYRVIQVQPLQPGILYHARIIAIDEYGRTSAPSTTIQFQHNNTRVEDMRTRLNGFFDDFNLPAGPFDELKWNQSYSGCAKIGYNSQHINNQFHAHNVVASDECDRAFASSRAREVFDFTNRTGKIEFDLDGSKQGRQRWYLDITNANRKRDLTGLIEVGANDINYIDSPSIGKSDPPFLLRINETSDIIFIQYIDENGVLVDLPNMVNNGACGQNPIYCPVENMVPIPNVRKHWEIEISKTYLRIFIDDVLMIDGSLVTSVTPNGLPFEEAQLNWIWFSYNTTKDNMPLSMVHWDNFGFDAPTNWQASTQIHNYTDGILGTENDPTTNDYSNGLECSNTTPAVVNIPIPDQILDANGNAPLSAELMFTIQGSYYDWNTNDHFEINGTYYPFAEPTSQIPNLLPNQFISTFKPYSAIVDIDPADLVTGNNSIAFYLNNPRLLNIHIELTYPVNAAPTYTQPAQIHSNYVDKLMNFNQFNNIGASIFLKDLNGTHLFDNSEYQVQFDAIEQIRYFDKINPVSGNFTFDVYGYSDAQLAAKALASGIAYYEVWIDKKVYKTVNVSAQEYASYFVHEEQSVNTTSLSNGIHELFVQAYDYNGNVSVFDVFGNSVGFGEYYPIRFTVNNAVDNFCASNLYDVNLGGGNSNPITADSYFTDNEIISSGKIEIGNSVIFSGANTVELTNGFEVEKGGFFIANNDGCFNQ